MIIRMNGSVTVKGWAGNRVVAETGPRQAVQLKRRAGAIEIQLSGDDQVLAPFNSQVELYCGSSAEIEQIAGPVSAFASHDLRLRQVQVLPQASVVGSLEIDCHTVDRLDLRFTTGRDLRCRLLSLAHVRYIIDDLSGRWDRTLGDGRVQVRLKAGGDVTLLADDNR